MIEKDGILSSLSGKPSIIQADNECHLSSAMSARSDVGHMQAARLRATPHDAQLIGE
jgi:hypothetical protein